MNNIAARLGVAIRRFRKKRGYSQEELAARAGIHYTALNGIETGRRLPSLRTVNKITRALRISMWEILLLAEPEYRQPYLDEAREKGLFKEKRNPPRPTKNSSRK